MSLVSRLCTSFGRATTLVLLLLSAGCAKDDSPTGPDGRPDGDATPLQVTVVTAGLILDRITAEVTAPDIPTPLVFNLPLANGVSSGIIRLPPGDDRTITLRAYDETGAITHEGSATVDVRPGMNMPGVSITLRSRAGQVPISGTLGTYSLQVVSVDENGVIGRGLAEQYVVRVTDLVSGNEVVVPAADIAWAVTNPAFATVSATGLVTGVAAGNVFVVATYEGAAGVAPLLVVPENTGIVRLSVASLQLGGPIQSSVEIVDGAGTSTFGGTDVDGLLQFSPLPFGSGSVRVYNVPSGCTAPPTLPIQIPNGGVASVEVLVTCGA